MDFPLLTCYHSVAGNLKKLRPATLDGYQRAINRDLEAWKHKPLKDISGAMAVTRHAELCKSASPTVAMRAMQVLRATHRFATEFYGTDDAELPFGRCPVDKINKIQRKWSQSKPRTGRLAVDELAPWLTAVRNLPSHQKRSDGDWKRVAAYLELILLTGLRRREAGFLRWEDVDLRRSTFTVRATKNGDDHTLPISARVRELFELRREAGKALQEIAQRHPTERNIKAALNHKTTGDVTGLHYAQVTTEDLLSTLPRPSRSEG
ncbi:tyrosine-type recombinase/integrase [Thiohalocapsa marina]|uniref:Tyrosine-type recombinase/integrase n=1 Tax=Thiohalocapsa marina TaxID=424902 RepID=A0A5M8FGV7_9GAMM|nr:tyrosine-type recombinase/integrase [Thiohalocapsa marina]KAA6184108.1 tyrosine-type recombinase/integrase [Thiohalocapsa marina]